MAQKYRSKPVEIEATRWDGSADEAIAIIDWMDEYDAEGWVEPVRDGGFTMSIGTLEGVMTASPGDFIIKGLRNEFYPCKPDVFEQKYEAV